MYAGHGNAGRRGRSRRQRAARDKHGTCRAVNRGVTSPAAASPRPPRIEEVGSLEMQPAPEYRVSVPIIQITRRRTPSSACVLDGRAGDEPVPPSKRSRRHAASGAMAAAAISGAASCAGDLCGAAHVAAPESTYRGGIRAQSAPHPAAADIRLLTN